MNAHWHAPAAIAEGLKDVVSGRLSLLALMNLVLAGAITAGAAWAGVHYLAPLIFDGIGPDGSGSDGTAWWAPLSVAGEFIAGAAIVVLAAALSPAVSMAVGGALFDTAAARTEKDLGLAPSRAVPIGEGVLNGLRIAGPALGLNLLSLPLLFVPVVNLIWFLALNGHLMGREYFMLAAVRRMSWADARALRRRNGFSVFCVGLLAALMPFIAPLFGAAAMTRLVATLCARSDKT